MKQTVFSYEQFLSADTITPVSAYLNLRDNYREPILLESADYRGSENAASIFACNPLATFEQSAKADIQTLKDFLAQFTLEVQSAPAKGKNGFFGFTTYDAVQSFEDITFQKREAPAPQMPFMRYSLYEFVVTINHYNHEMVVTHNSFEKISASEVQKKLTEFSAKLFRGSAQSSHFSLVEKEKAETSDEAFCEQIGDLKKHIQRGDIFQVVPSRRFSQKFRGDDFTLYRALRKVNPSPYLYYFDYGDFRLFGSSPEAQVVIKDGIASLNPIAGTYKRTGNDTEDRKAAEKLQQDPKEISEHVMLVDLARNDLSKYCTEVSVEQYREIQVYSHVIHLVSKVSGKLLPNTHSVDVFAGSFPAGTVSGAPKYRAMELIDAAEPVQRTFYAGSVGFYEFNGNTTHAIVIRSLLSQDYTLHYQAGAGIVADSVAELELQEIKNKLGALRKAFTVAEDLV